MRKVDDDKREGGISAKKKTNKIKNRRGKERNILRTISKNSSCQCRRKKQRYRKEKWRRLILPIVGQMDGNLWGEMKVFRGKTLSHRSGRIRRFV